MGKTQDSQGGQLREVRETVTDQDWKTEGNK